MAIDTNTLKEHFFNKAIPTDKDFSNLIDLAATGQNAVVDNKDGTEQLNGVQVQPFNKLSDTIGGRNLLINTAQLNDSTVCLYKKSNISDTYLGLNIYQTNSKYDGEKIYWSYLAPKVKTNTNYVMSEYVRNTSPTTTVSIAKYGAEGEVVFNSNWGPIATLPPNSGWTRISAIVNVASFPTPFPTTFLWVLRFENTTALTDGYVQFAGLKFEQGSIATDWTPAPEDKVNVTDMRKPASDVAGIEEVNAKQDKIGYTPADDSKVVHDSGNEEIGGQKTFDTAPIDKTTGNPYITKSDVTTAISAATATKADDTTVVHKTGANNFDTVPTYGTNNKPFAINDNGATSDRPTTGIYAGYQYYDTDLKKPIWYNGSAWTDSTGAKV